MKICPVCKTTRYLSLYLSVNKIGSIYICKKCKIALFNGKQSKYAGADIEEKGITKIAKKIMLWYEFRHLKNTKKKNILEIGSGSGELAYLLTRFEHNVTCNDVDKKSLQRIKQKYNYFTMHGSIDKISMEKKQFDMIIMRHVFEHIDNPFRFIRKIRLLLNKKGSLILTQPNHDSYCRKIMGKYWTGYCFPSHRYAWNLNNLSLFLQDNGFTIKKKYTIFSHFGLPMNVINLIQNKTLRSIVIPFAFLFGIPIEIVFSFINKGQNLFIEAYKK